MIVCLLIFTIYSVFNCQALVQVKVRAEGTDPQVE